MLVTTLDRTSSYTSISYYLCQEKDVNNFLKMLAFTENILFLVLTVLRSRSHSAFYKWNRIRNFKYCTLNLANLKQISY